MSVFKFMAPPRHKQHRHPDITDPAHVRANCPPNVYAADPTGKWWSKLLQMPIVTPE